MGSRRSGFGLIFVASIAACSTTNVSNVMGTDAGARDADAAGIGDAPLDGATDADAGARVDVDAGGVDASICIGEPPNSTTELDCKILGPCKEMGCKKGLAYDCSGTGNLHPGSPQGVAECIMSTRSTGEEIACCPPACVRRALLDSTRLATYCQSPKGRAFVCPGTMTPAEGCVLSSNQNPADVGGIWCCP